MTALRIAIENLWVGYGRVRGRDPRPANAVVRGASFVIEPGEVLGLVGESGCGKTTLARALAGLVPIASGAVRWGGRDIAALAPRERRRGGIKVGFVFQDPQGSLDPRMPVWRLITEELAISGARGGAMRAAAAALLDQVQLPADFLDRKPFELSGGQRQRLATARAICGEPDLLILDEPTSALDVTVQAQILKLLGDLRTKTAGSMLLISHDLHVVRTICDRIAVLLNGEIVEIGPTQAVLSAPKHRYTRELIAATPTLHRSALPSA